MSVPDTYTVALAGEKDTDRLGRTLGKALAAGDIVGLVGPLGAGKTRLTRAVAAGAGVAPQVVVNSPSFTILNIYDTPDFALYHLDLYRLAGADDLESIGLADMLSGDGALVVEWFDRFPEAFPPDHLVVRIEDTGEDSRLLSLQPKGPFSEELAAEVIAAFSGD